MKLSIISPYTHLNGHYWPYTMDLINALGHAGHDCSVFASRSPRYPLTTSHAFIKWHECGYWNRWLLSDSYRAKNWGNKPDSLVRNMEFYSCLQRCLQQSDESVHIHCIEARHRILLREVCRSRNTFSCLCVGEPPQGINKAREDEYRRAFDTGRLTFIVETDDVRAAWEYLAGEHVIHIPAALPFTKHVPLPQVIARQNLGLPERERICLFFGTHREGKDYFTAIAAAKASTSKPYLLFVGPLISGNDPAVVAADARYSKFESWSGYFPDDQVPMLFDAADAVILPYMEHYAKGSAVLLQAAHYAKPVIAAASGHLKDFVTENKTGMLYECGSVNSLAACYDELDAIKISNSITKSFCFDKTAAAFSWSNLIEKYIKIFNIS